MSAIFFYFTLFCLASLQCRASPYMCRDATPDMKPEEAAQIIGGMALTNQLIITFNGGSCDLIPDGHVNVIAS